jgi:hypothetical protein
MGTRRIVFVASIAVIALSGCATHQQTGAVARLTESDVRPTALPADLVGTWNGSVWTVGADAGGVATNVTLTINDDGTYTGTEERRGRASTQTFSGVVTAKGRTITFRDSSGRSISLAHRGDALYGVMPDRISGYRVHASLAKNSGTVASPQSAQSGRK